MAAKTIEWDAVRQLYEDKSVPLDKAAKLAGMRAGQLSRYAKENGWTLRTAKSAVTDGKAGHGKVGAAKAGAGKTSAAKAPKKPGELVKRVYATIDGELSKLEQQRGLTSQDRERASRALSQMVNSLEKAIEMQHEMTKRQAKGSGKKDKEALAHAEDIRREIAQRLEKLQRGRLSAKGSE